MTTELPTLESAYTLAPEQKASYQENGHVLLPGVADADEVAAFRGAINDAVGRLNRETRPLHERNTYGKAFLQVSNLWTDDEHVRRFVLARRFARIAAELMGVDHVRLYHDQALFKEPGGGPTPWHQDQFYWPLDTDNTVTLWMPLVDIPAQVGGMRFASKSHQNGYLGDLPISDESEAQFNEFIQERGFPIAETGAMRAGDATFHSGWTLHGAPGNPTETLREVMTIIYFADGARISPPRNKSQENDLQRWLPGCAPGDLAASPLNPQVY